MQMLGLDILSMVMSRFCNCSVIHSKTRWLKSGAGSKEEAWSGQEYQKVESEGAADEEALYKLIQLLHHCCHLYFLHKEQHETLI